MSTQRQQISLWLCVHEEKTVLYRKVSFPSQSPLICDSADMFPGLQIIYDKNRFKLRIKQLKRLGFWSGLTIQYWRCSSSKRFRVCENERKSWRERERESDLTLMDSWLAQSLNYLEKCHCMWQAPSIFNEFASLYCVHTISSSRQLDNLAFSMLAIN